MDVLKEEPSFSHDHFSEVKAASTGQVKPVKAADKTGDCICAHAVRLEQTVLVWKLTFSGHPASWLSRWRLDHLCKFVNVQQCTVYTSAYSQL